MATDLFGKYYNNPTKSYIYTNLQCNAASADEISFDIVDTDGVISDNTDTLSKIDLSDVHVSLNQYTNDMKVINPKEMIYIRGVDQGLSYTNKAFGKIDTSKYTEEQILYNSCIKFVFKYINDLGVKTLKQFTVLGDEETSVIDNLQESFDTNKITVNVKYEEGFIYFTATAAGFDFWIPCIQFFIYDGTESIQSELTFLVGEQKSNAYGFGYDNEWMKSSGYTNASNTHNAYIDVLSEDAYRDIYDNIRNLSTDTDDSLSEHNLIELFLFEDISKYIPAHKYRNGAMKGCVVIAKYPVYNAESITESQCSLKIGHLVDRVEEFYTSKENEYYGLPLYVRILRDVVDSYFSQYEFDTFNKWTHQDPSLTDDWIDPEEIPYVEEEDSDWSHSKTTNIYVLNTLYKYHGKYEAIGLYGYANYLTKHNQWLPMGQLYARTAVEDDESVKNKNLINSFIIYNPNDFPVTVNYMTFA